jgi:hypothetical protein
MQLIGFVPSLKKKPGGRAAGPRNFTQTRVTSGYRDRGYHDHRRHGGLRHGRDHFPIGHCANRDRAPNPSDHDPSYGFGTSHSSGPNPRRGLRSRDCDTNRVPLPGRSNNCGPSLDVRHAIRLDASHRAANTSTTHR